jgi:hypothetical protein
VLPKGLSQYLAVLEAMAAIGGAQLFSAARVHSNNTLNFPLKEKE